MTETYEDIKRRHVGGNGAAAAPRFLPVRFADIMLSTSSPALVRGLIPREGLVVVWGPPKCGKSFWTFDLVMHIALGSEYRGRRVQKGVVVYIACEGERGLSARVEAFRQRHLRAGEDPALYLLTTRLDLVADVDELVQDVRIALGAECCIAIVVDTLNRSFGGSESRDEDMSAYVKATDKLREAFQAAVIVIHHCGVNGERPRGHTSLTGAADAQIAVKRDAAGQIIATVEFMKDGTDGEAISSRLAVVEIGLDDDGEPITSCVIEPADKASVASANRPKLTGTAKVGFDQFLNCMADRAEAVPPSNHVPAGIRGVTLTYWRACLEQAGVINVDGNPREQFRRIRVTLQEKGFIGVWGDFAWPSHSVTWCHSDAM